MSALQFLVPWKKKSIPQKILVVQHMVKGLPPLFRSTSNKTKAFEVRLFFFLVKLIVNWVDFYNLFFLWWYNCQDGKCNENDIFI